MDRKREVLSVKLLKKVQAEIFPFKNRKNDKVTIYELKNHISVRQNIKKRSWGESYRESNSLFKAPKNFIRLNPGCKSVVQNIGKKGRGRKKQKRWLLLIVSLFSSAFDPISLDQGFSTLEYAKHEEYVKRTQLQVKCFTKQKCKNVLL